MALIAPLVLMRVAASGLSSYSMRMVSIDHSRKQFLAHGRLRLFLLCLLVELVLLFNSLTSGLSHSVNLETTKVIQKEGQFLFLLKEREKRKSDECCEPP